MVKESLWSIWKGQECNLKWLSFTILWCFTSLTDWMWCLQERFRQYSSLTYGQEYHWSRYFRLLWKEMEECLKHIRPVASKSLSDGETQHSNIEREFLGVMFGIEHFKHFTFGRKTHIITDHKPLLPLFQISLTNTTLYLSRLLHCVSEYDVTLHYQPRSRMKFVNVGFSFCIYDVINTFSL